MRTHTILAAIALCLPATSKAAIEGHCESWKGGTEIRCLAKKISGAAPESTAFVARLLTAPATYSYSKWWSACGAAGVILAHSTLVDLPHTAEIYSHVRLNLPNECTEEFYFGCAVNGAHVPCTSIMSARVTPTH